MQQWATTLQAFTHLRLCASELSITLANFLPPTPFLLPPPPPSASVKWSMTNGHGDERESSIADVPLLTNPWNNCSLHGLTASTQRARERGREEWASVVTGPRGPELIVYLILGKVIYQTPPFLPPSSFFQKAPLFKSSMCHLDLALQISLV